MPKDDPTIAEISALRLRWAEQSGGTVAGYMRLMREMNNAANAAVPGAKNGARRRKSA